MTAVTLAAALGGGALFALAGAPMPWVLGSLVVVGLGALMRFSLVVPRILRDLAIAVIGVNTGGQISGLPFDDLASAAVAIAATAGFLCVSIQLGYLYYRRVARFDRPTSILAAVPGGLAHVAVMADRKGLPIRPLVIIHTLRIAIVVSALPLVFAIFMPEHVSGGGSTLVRPPPGTGAAAVELADLLFMAAIAAGGWAASQLARLPAAPLLGPALLSLAAHQFGSLDSNPPALINIGAQLCIGAFIGSQFAGVSLRETWSAFSHGAAGGFLLMGAAIAGGIAASRFIPHSRSEMILAFAPGGLPEMVLLSSIVAADVGFVVFLHTLRIFLVLLLAPLLVSLIDRGSKRT